MIVEYIRYTIDPNRTGEFDAAYRRAGELLDASPHCRHWEAARSVDEPDKQIVRIEWDSVDGHLNGFRKSADFKPFLEATQPFFKSIEEMTHYEVVTTGGRTSTHKPSSTRASTTCCRRRSRTSRSSGTTSRCRPAGSACTRWSWRETRRCG